MKLITLNAWGGHIEKPLLEFVNKYSDTDIFCFQELYHEAENKIPAEDYRRPVNFNLFSLIEELLPEHQGYFRPMVFDSFGNGIFIKKSFDVVQENEVIIHHNPEYKGRGARHSRNLQWMLVNLGDDKQLYICNVHGLWNGKGKTDSPERIAQSHKIREFMDSKMGCPRILCGDFNLRPDTDSTRIIEKDLNNLVKTYNVESTRTSYYTKPEKYADYIFTSDEIKVNDFKVLDDEVSDHAALLLDFNVNTHSM